MRVLWFSTNSAGYKSKNGNKGGYNGGGWMVSLQNELIKDADITLGICFCINGEPKKEVQNGVTYYPIPHHKKKTIDKVVDILKIHDVTRDEILWRFYIEEFKKVILDFKPDVIEVFGSELYVGLSSIAAKELNIPCCLHIQGILNMCMQYFLPPGVSKMKFYFSEGFKNLYHNWQYLAYWHRSCHREKAILNAAPHVIGRTEWDKNAMKTLAPNALYHHGGEILRPCFYEKGVRLLPKTPIIVTTSSGASYKGFDLILKIAFILKRDFHLQFEWRVFGNISPKFFENITGINHSNVNIRLCGVASAEKLREEMLSATLYLQPSYIENSPNSIAEAQMLGLPVVATNVGGTVSMVKDGETGFLFPAKDPYLGACQIMKALENYDGATEIGYKGQKEAVERHNKNTIINSLIKLYKELCHSNGKNPTEDSLEREFSSSPSRS